VRYRVDPTIWDLPQFAEIPFDQLVNDYLLWLETRTERGGPAAHATIKAARATLKSFRKALVVDTEPLVRVGGKEPGLIRRPGKMVHPYLTGMDDGHAETSESGAE
jgi:hypothetical protein